MALFVAKHQHEPDTCPAKDPVMGPMLLQHVSRANAAEQFGVNIHGEAVIENAHTLYLIVDAEDQAHVEKFMGPFAQVGTAEVLTANPCEVVVGRAAC